MTRFGNLIKYTTLFFPFASFHLSSSLFYSTPPLFSTLLLSLSFLVPFLTSLPLFLLSSLSTATIHTKAKLDLMPRSFIE